MNQTAALTKLIERNRIMICVGSGGVGKTTISASLAIRAAQMGRKVLVMTIDPSRRLRDALGLVVDSSQAVPVPGQKYSGQLSAQLLNAEHIFKEFILQSTHRRDLAELLLKNRLYQQLSTTLSGSQEFTSLLQLSKIVSESDYDTIILDTPPAQHALDFLEAPEKIEALFQDNIVRWFIGDEDEVGLIRKMISRGTRTVLGALEKITGSTFMRELNDFFVSVRGVQAKINEKTQQVREILFSQNTGFVLITGFDVAKLKEASLLKAYLDQKGYRLAAVVINRAFPLWTQGQASIDDAALAATYDMGKILPVVRIPDLNKELTGLEGLEVMVNEMDSAFGNGGSNG
jgi:anion-transporting  ArsA/GET3 family ATPase